MSAELVLQDREKLVELIRVDTMKIADHRRMFEFFTDIKLRIKVLCSCFRRAIRS